MTGRALYFSAPRTVEVRDKAVPDPDPAEVLVRAECSAISSGTELLLYRDEVSDELAADETIDVLDEDLSFPLQYGYASVGRVTATGRDVDDAWLDRRVFAFHPHESHYLATPDALVPTTLPTETATLTANMETAVNFALDGRPRIGERAVVFGQGPVGLLTTAVLSSFPLAELVTVDRYEQRRSLSRDLGADAAVAPADVEDVTSEWDDGADLTYELSGNPAALNDAIDVTGYAGRVIVGSWYGTKGATLDLGGEYHRSHIRIRSSQVSRIDPDHAGRWDTDRRMDLAQERLDALDVADMVTHRFHVDRADEAYQLLDEAGSRAVQVLLTYD